VRVSLRLGTIIIIFPSITSQVGCWTWKVIGIAMITIYMNDENVKHGEDGYAEIATF